MTRRSTTQVMFALGALVLAGGCMPKMTIEEMQAMIPPRPAELDALNAFVGSWVGEGEATMAGVDQTLKSSGRSEAKWDGSNRYLVEQGSFTMDGFDPMSMTATWTYDTHKKVYRSTWTDSMGGVGMGTARISKDGTWTMRATAYGPFGKTLGKGHIKFLDADTAEWKWAEYAMGGLFKTMEMTGVNRRQ